MKEVRDVFIYEFRFFSQNIDNSTTKHEQENNIN